MNIYLSLSVSFTFLVLRRKLMWTFLLTPPPPGGDSWEIRWVFSHFKNRFSFINQHYSAANRSIKDKCGWVSRRCLEWRLLNSPPWKRRKSFLSTWLGRTGDALRARGGVSQLHRVDWGHSHRTNGAPEVSHSRRRENRGGRGGRRGGDERCRERCFRFHRLLRVGVKGVAGNKCPTFFFEAFPDSEEKDGAEVWNERGG